MGVQSEVSYAPSTLVSTISTMTYSQLYVPYCLFGVSELSKIPGAPVPSTAHVRLKLESAAESQ